MRKTLSILPLGLCAAMAVNADVVQHEVYGSYNNIDSDDAFTAGYTYYLEAMETEGAVKEELPFLRRAGYVHGFVSDYEGDNAALLGGRYFMSRDVFIGGDYSFDTDETSDGILSVHGGLYFNDNSAYQVTLSRDFMADVTGVDLGLHSVVDAGGTASFAYGGGFGAGDLDEVGDTFFVRADATYYFTDYTGAGIELAYQEAADFLAYQFEVSHYLNERLGFILSAGESIEDAENVQLAVRARF